MQSCYVMIDSTPVTYIFKDVALFVVEKNVPNIICKSSCYKSFTLSK